MVKSFYGHYIGCCYEFLVCVNFFLIGLQIFEIFFAYFIRDSNNKKETYTKKIITLTHDNKSTHKMAKSFRKLEYNIAYTTNNTIQTHLINKTTHNTKHEKHTPTGVFKLK